MIHVSSDPNQYWAFGKLQPTATAKSIVLTGESDQTWRGFGGCFNEIGWDQLSFLESSKRTQILDDLFAPDGALKFNEHSFNQPQMPAKIKNEN